MKSSDYYIMYNPLAFDVMDLHGKAGVTPLSLVSYLTDLDPSEISTENFLDYLDFDMRKHREGMVETFGIESYATLYVGNQIADAAPDATVIQVDGLRKTFQSVIRDRGRNPKCVFITSMSPNFPTAVATALILNRANIPVVIGGIHVSCAPADVDTFIRNHAPFPRFVSQVIGPGDSAVIEKIVADLNNNSLKPEYRGYTSIEDGYWAPRDNVDYLPPFRMEYLRRFGVIGKFVSAKMRITPVAPFLGCPYSCNFCSISSLPPENRKFTCRSADDFLDELEYHQQSGQLQNRFFFFLPDNLMLGKRLLEDISSGIIRRKLKVNFAAQISIDVASDEALLKRLRMAGATHFFIGFESLNLDNLKFIGKPVVSKIEKLRRSVKDYYKEQIAKIHSHGISIHGAFIFGLPYDNFNSTSDNTGIETAKFCAVNHIGLQPCSLTDLPGSTLFTQSQKENTWLYGSQGSIDYLIGLCLTDLTETNRRPPQALQASPLIVASMAFESIKLAGSSRVALSNGLYLFWRALLNPTYRGQSSLKERLIDAYFAFASQLIVSLYRLHGEGVAYSRDNFRGGIERLYDFESNEATKIRLREYAESFRR